MFHYEAFRNHTSESYNKTVDSFDVSGFAKAVERTRCGHVIFVIGQHWWKYCAPNSAYEKLLGVENGVWTSRRDLILEIGEESRQPMAIVLVTVVSSVVSAFVDNIPYTTTMVPVIRTIADEVPGVRIEP